MTWIFWLKIISWRIKTMRMVKTWYIKTFWGFWEYFDAWIFLNDLWLWLGPLLYHIEPWPGFIYLLDTFLWGNYSWRRHALLINGVEFLSNSFLEWGLRLQVVTNSRIWRSWGSFIDAILENLAFWGCERRESHSCFVMGIFHILAFTLTLNNV